MRPPFAWHVASALALAVALTIPVPISAQLVEVPTFVVATPAAGSSLQFFDVAAGADDAMVFTWLEPTTATEQWPAFARHVSAGGLTLTAPVRLDQGNGVLLTRVVADGLGGYLAAWLDRGLPSYAIQARRLGANGKPTTLPITVDADGNPYRSLAIAAAPAGNVVAWRSGAGVSARRFDASGQPLGAEIAVRNKALAGDPRVRVAFVGGGGFLVSWMDMIGSWARRYDASGEPIGEAFELAEEFQPWDLAVSPLGGFTVVGSRDVGTHALPAGVWARRFDPAAQPLGPAFVVDLPITGVSGVAAEYDPAGRLVVTWTQYGPGAQHVRARLYAADGTPLGAAFAASDEVVFSDHVLAVRPDGRIVNGWREGFALHANVLTPCVPPFHTSCGDGVATAPCEQCDQGAANSDSAPDACRTNCARPSCGDGVVDTGEQCDDGNLRGCDGCDAECMLEVGWTCGDGTLLADCGEQCDDGAANSDVTPDACRTNCRLPACGDDVVDTGETCDDGNRTPCDGCSDFCISEPGLVCGDGIAEAHCGEPCDDGNSVDGDGCVESCRLETIPGGGPTRTDCKSVWVVDNPTNTPRYDKNGFISAQQVCRDGDPLCDFDGMTDGRCTMRMRVCGNASGIPNCYPGFRLFSWTLLSPSAGKAAHDPAAAAVRAAFSGLPGVLVGPTAADNCSDMFDVVVPLGASGTGPGKLVLKSRAENYLGERDIDKLRLLCLPPS